MDVFTTRVAKIIIDAIESKVFPGCVLGIVKDNKVLLKRSFGHFTYDLDSKAVSENTLYDIASVTKQIVATGALMLFDQKKIAINEVIGNFLPELKDSAVGSVTIHNLLTHTSCIKIKTSELTQKEFQTFLTSYIPSINILDNPGSKVEYANINTFILGEIVARVSGMSLKKFLSENIFTPLKMTSTLFCPEKNMRIHIPPTEILKNGTLIQGVVHDESSRMMGGNVGQAGLFSNVDDLINFLLSWLGYGEQILKPETIIFATRNHTAGLNKLSGLGWHLDNKEYLGEIFQPHTFFHPGFTGTIIGGNKKSNLGFVILSNCTYPHREKHMLKNKVFQDILTECFKEFNV